MDRIAKWFLSGVLIGGTITGLVFFGAFLERSGTEPDSMIIAAAPVGSVAFAQELPQVREQSIAMINDQLYVQRQNGITNAIRNAAPAVVGITVTQIREVRTGNPLFDDPFFRNYLGIPEQRRRVENLGSGFILTPDGYVVTNEHVVHAAVEIVVTTTTGEHYTAELIGSDFDTDLALVKINGENLPHLNLEEDDDVIVGEWAIAIGNPFGLFDINDQPSVSVGVVSAMDRDFERNQQGRIYQGMIQTDAAINQGNSGGPLVNVLGHVIGLNTFIFSQGGGGSVGVGFAIPVSTMRPVIEQLRERGSVDRNFWTGIAVQSVDRLIAMSLGFTGTGGVIITDIEKDSPAEQAQLHPTDIITRINNVDIVNTRTVQDFFNNRDLRVGDELVLKIFRDGREMDVPLTLEAREK